MNERTENAESPREEDSCFMPQQEQPDYIVHHLAKLGIIGLEDERYTGSSQELLDPLTEPFTGSS
ncbi:MAG: hypothetical protein ACQR33_02230 [Candidatus Saccharibacteria bacterium]